MRWRSASKVALALFVLFSLLLGVHGLSAAQAPDADANGAVDDEGDEVKRAIEEAAAAVKESLGAIPDPAQALTQASMEALSQGRPELERQFVYSISVWNGAEYTGTFAPSQADTVYLAAGWPAIVNAQRTDVYYWPITGEYMADWFGYKEEVPGTLEIVKAGQTEPLRLERTKYSYAWPDGLSNKQVLLLGDDAVKAYEDYESRIDAYYAAVSAYYDANAEWQRQMSQILREVNETGIYKDPSEIPAPPQAPTQPTDFVYQARESFVLDLPPGTYTMRVRDEDGNIVPGSEKKLDVFAPRREGTGFEVRPEHKWTRGFPSIDPSDILYLDGRRVFYVIPREAKEFNLYKWVKMTNLHKPLEGEGTSSAWGWALFDPIEGATLQVMLDGEVVETISLEPYYVRQTGGHALGYDIIPFDPESDPTLEGKAPSFYAYRVALEAEKGGYQIRFVDADGNPLLGSEREVRSVRHSNWAYAVPLFPLAVGVVMVARRRSVKRGSSVALHGE